MVRASSQVRFIAQWVPAILGFVLTLTSLSSLVGIVTAILLAVIVTLVLWIASYQILRAEPSTEKGLLHQEQFRRVTADLHAHYKGIIDRMDQNWDYRPKYPGEQIFMKGSAVGSQSIPQNLAQDKSHLREFSEPWEIYSKGPSMYSEAKKFEEQTRQLVKSHLTGSLLEVKPPAEFLSAIASEIIDRVNSRNLGQYARDFEATMITVVNAGNGTKTEHPIIDPWLLEGWALSNAEKLAGTMNKILSLEDVRELVGKRRLAWDTVTKNKNDFLTALREKVIGRATSSNYQLPELTGGICDDCTHLKAERDLLLGKSA